MTSTAARHCLTLAGAALLCGLALSAPAVAQDSKTASREREALRRAQTTLRETQQARDALQADKARLEAEALAQAGRLKQQQARLVAAQSAQAELRALRATQQKTADELAQALQAVAAGTAALREAKAHSAVQQQDHQQQIATLRRERDERSSANRALVARLEAATQALAEAQERNRQLHAVGEEALQRLRGRTAVDQLLLKERVLGLAAVRLDSQAEELLMRLDPAIGKDHGVHRPGTAAAESFERDSGIRQQRVQHAPGERSMGAATLKRQAYAM